MRRAYYGKIGKSKRTTPESKTKAKEESTWKNECLE